MIAPEPTPLRVTWDGSFLDMGSLSHVNRELTGALAADSRLEITRAGKQDAAEVTVRHAWPPLWQRPATGAWVLIQPWEYGAIPRDWIAKLAKVDEIWAPTEYVRRVYVESGIEPYKIKIVPNGIDPARFRPGLAPLPLATKKKFKFLFVGGTIPRKGADLLLRAYAESFSAADDVCLVIKDFGGQSVYQGQTLEKEIAAARGNAKGPEIIYLTDEMPEEAMPRLYAACDCLVHPYRGEGFGLPALEAMACGLPVVVTGGGATDDFATDTYAYRLPSARRKIGDRIGNIALCHEGWLLEPVSGALATRLRWIVAHSDEARELGRAASDYARREWTWERAAHIASERLRDLAARKKAEAAALATRRGGQTGSIPLPAAAAMGRLDEAIELVRGKQWPAAWAAALSALNERPCHPEAYLLLAGIAQAAGDADAARRCAKAARDMAPDWAPPKQFLKGNPPRGASKLEWLKIPEAISDRHPAGTPRISVCLIARNEERFLGQCLRSVRALASQIVVVDTGSTDRTVEIARENGAEVYHFPWCDDFSAARNAALEHATGDWVLIIDADEELPPEQAQVLVGEIQVPVVMGYRLPIVENRREREGCSHVLRLFRNAPGLYFAGRIHEQIVSSIQSRCRQWGLKHQLGKTAIVHHGYAEEIMASRNKVERNLRLLERAVEESPGEPHFLLNLGLEMVRSGKLEAGLDRYWEAFRLLSMLPADEVSPEGRETLLTHLTTHLGAAKRYCDIVQLWRIPFARNGGMTASQHFGLGAAHMELGQYAEAAGHLRQCIEKRNVPALSPINREIRKAGPHHCLALCLIALNDAQGAQRAFDAALAADPSSRAARFDLARFLAAQGRTGDALKTLRELAAENAGEPRVWELGGQIALMRPEHLEFARGWTGEAVGHFPGNQKLLLQRAEALLLNQDVAQALPLWRGAQGSDAPRQRAAIVLCELLAGDRQHRFTAAEEPAISQEAVQWYRRCIRMGAHGLIRQLHERMETIRLALPEFVRVLETAHRQASRAAA